MLIPDNIENFNSLGEKLLYLRFKDDESVQNYFIMHSVFTNHHLTNVPGELDFLVLAPGKGFFAIEVKHGGVRREKGTWYFTNRNGKTTKKTKGPFRQVEDTKHSIRNYILNNTSGNKILSKRLSKVLFASGVAFTSMRSDQVNLGPECFSWQILTNEGLRLPISKYIEVLSKGWHEQYKSHPWYDVNESRPTVKDCENVLEIIRGDFKLDYAAINRISDNEKLIEEFTKAQFHVLDFANFNDQCLFQGQAGTGKTVLATELVRRKISQGKKIGFFCFNKKLGKKISKSLTVAGGDKTNSFAGTLHKYLFQNVTGLSWTDSDRSDFFKEELPIEFLLQNEGITETDKFDVLVIDEAQDLITDYYLEIFDWILKGGIKNGRWIMFGDFTNQAIYLDDPKEAHQLLKSKSHFSEYPPLKVNCRNTKKIAIHNTLLTGAELPSFNGKTVSGKPINAKFPVKSKQANETAKIVKELLNNGVKRDQITLLSPNRFENTHLSDSEYINRQIDKGLEVTTIHSFKGLENVIIILFGFDDIKSDEVQRLLYVGISRATQELALILDS